MLIIRLLLLCAVPTAVTAWMELSMLARADLGHWSATRTLLAFGTIAAQTAVTCGFTGWYLPDWRWRMPTVVCLLLLTNFELASINMHGGFNGLWVYGWMWVGAWWIAWTLLASLFLASLLLVVRAAGYRFLRR